MITFFCQVLIHYLVCIEYLFLKQNLKEALEKIIPEKQKEVAEFRTRKGNAKVGEVTVDMVS